MATEPVVENGTGGNAAVSSSVETQNQTLDVVEAPPEIDAPEGDVTTEGEASETDADKALKKLQRRIDKRTADVYRTRAENEQLKERLARLEAQTRTQEEGQTDSRVETDPLTLAREIARIDRFAEQSNQFVDYGTKKHDDFMATLKHLSAEVGDLLNRDQSPSKFMEVVLEVAETKERRAELLYHLGQNPEIAETLVGLNQIQLARKLDRIEREIVESSKPKLSNAPKPLEPVKGKASDSELGPGLSDAEWMKRREAQLRADRGR